MKNNTLMVIINGKSMVAIILSKVWFKPTALFIQNTFQ